MCVYVCVYVYTEITFSLSIHLSIDGFCILWIMLQWTWKYRYLFKTLISCPMNICSEVGLLDHVVILFFIFQGPSLLFCLVSAPVSIFTSSAHMFPFIHVFASTCYLLSFWWWPSEQMWGDSSCWFSFAFPWWFAMLSASSYIPVGHLCAFHGRMSIQFAHFLIRLLSFMTELYEFFIYCSH